MKFPPSMVFQGQLVLGEWWWQQQRIMLPQLYQGHQDPHSFFTCSEENISTKIHHVCCASVLHKYYRKFRISICFLTTRSMCNRLKVRDVAAVIDKYLVAQSVVPSRCLQGLIYNPLENFNGIVLCSFINVSVLNSRDMCALHSYNLFLQLDNKAWSHW